MTVPKLAAIDLNDFISPSVACVKPVEKLPDPASSNQYEVTTEEKAQRQSKAAEISLTDCLACSGCVTSAEAVLVSLQSHAEVLNTLDSAPSFLREATIDANLFKSTASEGKIFVASVSQQVRASLAATYRTSEEEAGAMIENLLSGPEGVTKGGRYKNGFSWVVDINPFRDIALHASAREMSDALADASCPQEENAGDARASPKLPILTSACPGWTCYAEVKHPHILPHLSRVKSPQALAGTLLKSTLAEHYGVDPARIWHLAIMPCFDKKLEASRQELTDVSWRKKGVSGAPVRDVDCVITAREILMIAESRGIHFPSLPKTISKERIAFPDPIINRFLFKSESRPCGRDPLAGTSGGFLYQMLILQQASIPGSKIDISPGRKAGVLDLSLISDDTTHTFKGSRCYGFNNIQNVVRNLKPNITRQTSLGTTVKPTRKSNTNLTRGLQYIEVMACPGGCTNGGGQIKLSDLSEIQSPLAGLIESKEWQDRVESAYFSVSEATREFTRGQLTAQPDMVRRLHASMTEIGSLISHWSQITDVLQSKLLLTTFRAVESNIDRTMQDTEKAASFAGKPGGGW